jgi:uncharacterized protein with HEPN domain
MRRERLYLEDIVTAADAIAEFTYAQNLESFEANLMLRVIPRRGHPRR